MSAFSVLLTLTKIPPKPEIVIVSLRSSKADFSNVRVTFDELVKTALVSYSVI